MDVLGNILLLTCQELHSLFIIPSLKEVLKQCLNLTSIFIVHMHKESTHPRCPGSRNWGAGQGEGASWYSECGRYCLCYWPTSRSTCWCLETAAQEYFKTENRAPVFETSRFLTDLVSFRVRKVPLLLHFLLLQCFMGFF